MRLIRKDWVLKEKIKNLITNDSRFRDELAVIMKIGSPAIVASIKNNEGRTVAKSFDGMKHLMEVTNLKEEDIREEVEMEYE